MANNTWGSTALKILHGTYRPPHGDAGIIEIPILPDLTAATPASVIQQAGRGRKRASWRGYVSALADYDTLYADYIAATVRTFTGPGGETLSAIIESLSEPEYVQANFIRFDVTIVEV